MTSYQKNWRNNNLWGINRSNRPLLKIYSNPDVSERIKKLFQTNTRYNSGLRVVEIPNRLEDYDIGSNIACGCDAAVYEARIRTLEKAERLPSSICTNLPFTSFSQRKQSVTKDPVVAYPYALKIMYNYEFDTSERHLWMDMGTELVPLIEKPPELIGFMANMTFLPHEHPNIVQMYKAFTDCMPVLEDAQRLYPEALPTAGFYGLIVDEPKTLFIVMRRQITCGTSVDDAPHLVLSDFGCALATGSWKVRYDVDTVHLGGNLALRAPEIRCAHPAPNNWVDFHMADLWAAATIGYEIFTRQQTNPFYGHMRSDQYVECELPALPKKVDCSVKMVIRDMLQIDPNKRPDPSVAANVLSISLFRFGHNLHKLLHDCGFDETLFGGKINDLKNAASKTLEALKENMIASVNNFTLLFAAETILARNIHPNVISTAELQLRATFLSRINHEYIWSALSYFCHEGSSSRSHSNFVTTKMGDQIFAAGDTINSSC
ncbi:unnamed protein product [Wuchereria bancrofti]|uniref:non-specific serine/threonine protein kinase n=1 Tax=Wuchereria bancrofti TaxID=6293 RepID=A0A3P7FFP9_WUCBA|nr:unnamed protein product [Wuchereria bancrofti]